MNLSRTDALSDAIRESIAVKQRLLELHVEAIETTGLVLAETAHRNGLIMLCGNGGSAADSQHIAAELVVRLNKDVNRRAIKALALTTDSSILTAGGNDYGFDRVFSRQVEAFGSPDDVLIAISTSGTSNNIVLAVEEARSRGIRTIGLLGGTGGTLAALCDASVIVPSSVTARIQECHILIGHVWCEMIEAKVTSDE
jgi:D-sedoheptulose 7-phosphate isomerase